MEGFDGLPMGSQLYASLPPNGLPPYLDAVSASGMDMYDYQSEYDTHTQYR